VSAAELKYNVLRYIKHYVYALFAKSWNSSVKAVDAFMGIAVGASLNPEQIQAPNWTMAAYIFGVVYARSVVSYLAENPIPTTLETSTP
jgi:hypothetical protein